MTPLAVVLLVALAAVGYGITLRVRAHLRDQRGYGRHAAASTPTIRAGHYNRAAPSTLGRAR